MASTKKTTLQYAHLRHYACGALALRGLSQVTSHALYFPKKLSCYFGCYGSKIIKTVSQNVSICSAKLIPRLPSQQKSVSAPIISEIIVCKVMINESNTMRRL